MSSTPTLLVTGGTGFIGSHTVTLLLQAGYQVVIIDNLSNSQASVIDAISTVSGKQPVFMQGDIRNIEFLHRIFSAYSFDAVLHFAGLKAVGESNSNPLHYYDNNVNGTLQLLRVMESTGVDKFIFSSSATVYGDPEFLPLTEQHPLRSTNPYGQNKLVTEHMLRDWHRSQPQSAIACLRYFNPVGAHPSGLLGENPQGTPNNLMPYIMQVANGQRQSLQVFGDDYPTPDGTGVRDYLHIMDLAKGHVLALEHLLNHSGVNVTVNLGTGKGYSVLEMLKAAEQASQKTIPYEIAPRRTGDIAACWADPSHALEVLGWKAEHSLEQMCADSWHWVQQLPTQENQ